MHYNPIVFVAFTMLNATSNNINAMYKYNVISKSQNTKIYEPMRTKVNHLEFCRF